MPQRPHCRSLGGGADCGDRGYRYRPMTRRRRLAAALLLTLLATAAAEARQRTVTDPQAPRALASNEGSPVQVDWTDPAQFTELRYSHNRWQAERGNWVEQLASYVQKAASKRLPPGQRLRITITDIKRAGDYEPWHGPRLDDVRVVKDIYPPRLSLRWIRSDASGQVIDQGEQKLVDTAFMMGATPINDNDPLRYEKRMIDDWLRQQLRTQRLATTP